MQYTRSIALSRSQLGLDIFALLLLRMARVISNRPINIQLAITNTFSLSKNERLLRNSEREIHVYSAWRLAIGDWPSEFCSLPASIVGDLIRLASYWPSIMGILFIREKKG